MPMRETVEELAETLADALGIYKQRLGFAGMTIAASRALLDATEGQWEDDHDPACGCRLCWCGRMETRIRDAVATEVLMRLAETREAR